MQPDKIKLTTFDETAHRSIALGIDTMAKAVGSTFGPGGRNVLIKKRYVHPILTRDGVTVARDIAGHGNKLEDPIATEAAKLVYQASEKTNKTAGDGPQPLYAKVLTPTGFVKMGDVVEGMEVCGTNGTIQKVLGVFEKGKKEIYRVNLLDGRVVECCADHLWTVTDVTNDGIERTLTVKQMLEAGMWLGNRKQRKYYIKRNVVDFQENISEMPLDAYTLGVLLGDGSLSGTGSIELSLGFNKRHILDKINLPEGVIVNTRDCDNYIRAKIPGLEIVNVLHKLGLYGKLSDTKFIPESYLYSSIASRKALLQGLIDTDGYMNKRGLFEFSTVSPQLATDFIDLARSLGYDLNVALHTRDNDPDSYSRNPIFRITQLMGRKYGMAIDSIESTGEETPMRCIKVSNPDNLYITDGYVVTHNTTATVMLLSELYKKGYQRIVVGQDAMLVKRQLDKDRKTITDFVKSKSVDCDKQKLDQVSTISSGDESLGMMISDLVYDIGSDGAVTIEYHNAPHVEVEKVTGYLFGQGFKYLSTDVEFVSPIVFVTQKRMATKSDIIPILELAAKNQKQFVIVGDVSGAALETLLWAITNQKADGVMIPPPAYGSDGHDYFEDIAIYTGARLWLESDSFSDVRLEDFGSVKRSRVSRDKAILFGDNSTGDEIASRIAIIREQMKGEMTPSLKEVLETRLAKLAGKVSIIKVGAATEVEREELFFRVEDAVEACKSALSSGVVAGGATTLLFASELDIDPFVREALCAPFRLLMSNSAEDGGYRLNQVLNAGYGQGFNLRDMTSEPRNLLENGIVDATKVITQVVENSFSVAGALLTTGTVITDKELDEKATK